MEKPDESWDACSTMNSTFTTAISGNNAVAANSPSAAKQTVPIPQAPCCSWEFAAPPVTRVRVRTHKHIQMTQRPVTAQSIMVGNER